MASQSGGGSAFPVAGSSSSSSCACSSSSVAESGCGGGIGCVRPGRPLPPVGSRSVSNLRIGNGNYRHPSPSPTQSGTLQDSAISVRGKQPVSSGTGGRFDDSRDPGGNAQDDEEDEEDDDDEEERGSADGFQDIHVAEQRPVNGNTGLGPGPGPRLRPRRRERRSRNWSDTSSVVSSSAYSSYAESESISLSREFNNVLNAARNNNTAAASVSQDALEELLLRGDQLTPSAGGLPLRSLPGIGEDDRENEEQEQQQQQQFYDQRVRHNQNQYEQEHERLALVASSSPLREPQQQQPTRSLRDSLALVPVDTPTATDAERPSGGSWRNKEVVVGSGSGSAVSVALEKVKREEIEAKARAWEEAKLAKTENRFKRDDAIISGWEDEQKVRASIKMKKVERKLEEKRAKAYENMQNEIAKARKKAQERRAVAEARMGAAKARISEATRHILSHGKLPRKFLFFTSTSTI